MGGWGEVDVWAALEASDLDPDRGEDGGELLGGALLAVVALRRAIPGSATSDRIELDQEREITDHANQLDDLGYCLVQIGELFVQRRTQDVDPLAGEAGCAVGGLPKRGRVGRVAVVEHDHRHLLEHRAKLSQPAWHLQQVRVRLRQLVHGCAEEAGQDEHGQKFARLGEEVPGRPAWGQDRA
jgi:hypothetical protein